ncbi:sigma-70 family RNA polymerase sigma factor [Candidatus Peregrinibacteria bacterium]|nr:sigma-70 family RNA polymerase sigma factor [Candidatus Peregrinibacteria bacterium]
MADFNEIYDRYFLDAYKYLALRIYDHDKVKGMLTKLFLYAAEQVEREPMALLPFLPFMYSFCWKMVSREPASTLKSVPTGKNRPVFYADSYSVEATGGEGPIVPQALLELVSYLTIEEREILWLKHFEELTDSEITRTLQLHPKEAPRRIYNAMQKTRDILANSSAEAARHINYFGNVNTFFENIKLSLNIIEDKNLKAEIKADVLAKKMAKASSAMPPQPEMESPQVVAEEQSTIEEAEPVGVEEFTPIYSEIEEDGPSFRELWRKIQGAVIAVFAILVVSFVGTMLYLNKTNFYSKIIYSADFSDREKSAFTKNILENVLPQRDFVKAEVNKSDSKVYVLVDADGGVNEEFSYKTIGELKWISAGYKKVY